MRRLWKKKVSARSSAESKTTASSTNTRPAPMKRRSLKWKSKQGAPSKGERAYILPGFTIGFVGHAVAPVNLVCSVIAIYAVAE